LYSGTTFDDGTADTKVPGTYHYSPDFTKGKKISVIQGKNNARKRTMQHIGAKMANSTDKTPL